MVGATSATGKPIYKNGDELEFNRECTSDITLYTKWNVTANTVGKINLTNIAGEYTIKVVGDITQSTLTTLADKMYYKWDLRINLDLSEAVLETIDSPCSGSLGIFYACPLYSIVFPETLKTIGEWAFHNSDNLKNVALKNITTISNYAFCDCTSLSSITIDPKQ